MERLQISWYFYHSYLLWLVEILSSDELTVVDLGGGGGVRGVQMHPPFTSLTLLCATCYPALMTAFGSFEGYAHYLEPPFPNF